MVAADRGLGVVLYLCESRRPIAMPEQLEQSAAASYTAADEEQWELELKSETAINKFYSPYPEVRAVTDPEDDPNTPCETIRAHLLGYLWASVAQFVNSMV